MEKPIKESIDLIYGIIDLQEKELNLKISYIELLKEEIKSEKEIVINLKKQVTELQSSCTHDYLFHGHTHNDRLYKCTICGHIDKQ